MYHGHWLQGITRGRAGRGGRGDVLAATACGFNVYGPDGFQGKGEPNRDGLAQLEFSYADADPGTLLGLSDPGPEPRNVGQVAEELHAMLVKAKVAPPYVLVGHSMGGMTIRMFAALWPNEVAGLVFVDGSHEELNARVNAQLTPEEVALAQLAPSSVRSSSTVACPQRRLPATGMISRCSRD